MECPYCHGAMEPGSVNAEGRSIFWYPQGKEVNLFATWGRAKRRGGFCVVGTFSQAEAWYCPICNQLTIFNAKAR